VRAFLKRSPPVCSRRHARNLPAVIANLPVPLGPQGDGRYRTDVWDLGLDRPRAAPEAILIVDGTFLNRPELAPHWDVHIFLDVSETTAIGRDAAGPGNGADIEAVYRARYLSAFDLYQSEANPTAAADFVISLEVFEAPVILRRPMRL